MKNLSIIVAVADNGAIGKQQELLCHLPNDLKRFKEITSGHTVIMGRRTYESLPKGALPNRQNIVLTRSGKGTYPNCLVYSSLEDALESARNQEKVFVIGGAAVYEEAMKLADNLYLTRIHHSFEDADTFFPAINESEWEVVAKDYHPADERHAYPYSFLSYNRKL